MKSDVLTLDNCFAKRDVIISALSAVEKNIFMWAALLLFNNMFIETICLKMQGSTYYISIF